MSAPPRFARRTGLVETLATFEPEAIHAETGAGAPS